SLDPVNEITLMSSCSTISSPTVDPEPNTTFKTPFGRPASAKSFASSLAIIGVSVAGFQITALPETIYGNDFHDAIAIGKFHGVMMPAMPTGARTLIANLSFNSAGVVWPNNLLPSPAM